MPRRSAYALAALLLLAPLPATCAAAATQASQPSLAATIDALIAPHFTAKDPGVTVIATQDGKTVFRKAYGLADVADGKAMTAEAPMRIGSMTKQFTAVGILLLADEGKLALTDDITRFLPAYPTHGARITIENLLTHTSGIPSYTGKRSFLGVMAKDVSVEQGIAFFKDDALEFAPGSRFSYDNSGYFLLGAIIEKVSGQPYARFLEQRIFKPLGMTHTGYEDASMQPVTGYDGQARKPGPISMTWPYAAGALVSTVDDLARWQAALAEGKLLRPETLRKAWTAQPLGDGKSGPYGYGWFVGRLNGLDEVSHGGNITGFTSDGVWLPQQRIYVAMLANREANGLKVPLATLTRQVALQLAGKPLVASEARLDAATLAGYVGVYPIDDKRVHTVRQEQGGLTIQGTGMPRAPLRNYKPDGFLIGDSLMTVQFQRDAQGIVTGMEIDSGPEHHTHRRVSATVTERPTVQVAAAVLDQYLGQYPLAPGFVIEVTRDGDALRAGPVGQPSVRMAALAQDLFLDAEHDAQLHFEKLPDGHMKVTLEQGPHKLSAERKL